jgi:hypothetical protein
MPCFIETLTENSGTDGDEALYAWSAPTHTCSTETALVLFGGTCYHATADGAAFHAHLEVVHAFDVVLEVPSLLEKGFGFVWLESGLAFDLVTCFLISSPKLKRIPLCMLAQSSGIRFLQR